MVNFFSAHQKTAICHLYHLVGELKFSYLCTVNEKRRNLRPNWVTKIT